LFVSFIFLSSYAVLNLLVGILCDVVSRVRLAEENQAIAAHLRETLFEILELHDKDGDKMVDAPEWDLIMSNPEMHLILKRCGVNINHLIDMKEVLFDPEIMVDTEGCTMENLCKLEEQRKSVPFEEMLEVILRLRGSTTATVSDIVDLRQYITQKLDLMHMRIKKHSNTTGNKRDFRDNFGPSASLESSYGYGVNSAATETTATLHSARQATLSGSNCGSTAPDDAATASGFLESQATLSGGLTSPRRVNLMHEFGQSLESTPANSLTLGIAPVSPSLASVPGVDRPTTGDSYFSRADAPPAWAEEIIRRLGDLASKHDALHGEVTDMRMQLRSALVMHNGLSESPSMLICRAADAGPGAGFFAADAGPRDGPVESQPDALEADAAGVAIVQAGD